MKSIHPRLGRDIARSSFDIVFWYAPDGQSMRVVFFTPRRCHARPCASSTSCIVAVLEVLAGVGPAGFLAVLGAFHGDHGLTTMRLSNSHRFHQVRVPDERTVGDRDIQVVERVFHDLVDLLSRPRIRRLAACGTPQQSACMMALHGAARMLGRAVCAALGVAEAVEPRRALFQVSRACGQRLLAWLAAFHQLFRSASAAARPKTTRSMQRVGTETVRAVHGDAGGLANRHQAWHDGIGPDCRFSPWSAPRRGSSWECRPCCNARSGSPGMGSLRDVHTRQRLLAAFRDAGQPLVQDLGRIEMVEMQDRYGPSACRRRVHRGFPWSWRGTPHRAKPDPWREGA